VGEIGAGAVSWSHENHAQPHALYQQMLGHLADCGVLLGVVSKNELPVVQEALARKDLLLDAGVLFPVMASWGAKSKAVGEVLRLWNIGADSVVFVDDNQMELDEVGQAFPQITGLWYPGNDAPRVWQLLRRLRDLFGKPVLTEEDRLRRDSIRAGAVIRESGDAAGSPEFLRGLGGTVTLDYARNTSGDQRALELINKTNQFNLNGLRLAEGEWQKLLHQPGTLAVIASYRDKFGPLGRIGVLVAETVAGASPSRLRVNHWVLSCRAFSRRIEHHMLDSLLRLSGAEEIEFAFAPTDRNQPLQEFMGQIGATEKRWQQTSRLQAACGPLPHRTEEVLA
jgi:FkbH-like protein